jgi:vacuolar-type H+-ATPase subunit E/Vma4
MAESELRTALQREGEAQIRDIWQQSEAAVASRRREIEAELARLRAETDRRLQAEISTLRNNMHFDAQTRAMKHRLHAETVLEERLLLLANQRLPGLASADRAALWKALCAELPSAEWAVCRIHPADSKSAACDFPAAEIEDDEALGGGLIVTTADDMIRIDNSLKCRLMRAWPDLLPKLLGELREQVDKDETAHTDKTG